MAALIISKKNDQDSEDRNGFYKEISNSGSEWTSQRMMRKPFVGIGQSFFLSLQ